MNTAECKKHLIASLPPVLLDAVKDVNDGTDWIRTKKYKVDGVWHRDFLLKDTIICATIPEGSDIKFWIMPEWKAWHHYDGDHRDRSDVFQAILNDQEDLWYEPEFHEYVVYAIKAKDYVFEIEIFDDDDDDPLFVSGASIFIQPANCQGWDQHLDIDSILPRNYDCMSECSYIAEGRSEKEARAELLAIGMKEENLI